MIARRWDGRRLGAALLAAALASHLATVLVTLAGIGRGTAGLFSFTVYRRAALAWWAGDKLYTPGPHGFLYLPVAAVLFTPFAFLGPVAGAALWCVLSATLYLSGLVRLARLAAPGSSLAVAVALLVCWAALEAVIANGQAQIAMTGLLLHGIAELARGRAWRSAMLLALAVALKPLAIATALTAGALYRPLRLPLAACGMALLLLPLLRPDPGFAVAEYGAALAKLQVAGAPAPTDWFSYPDIAALLHVAGLTLSAPAQLALRIVAAVATLVLAWHARRRPAGGGALALAALTLVYLTLFNPRIESQTYVALAPALGVGAGMLLARLPASAWGWLLAAGGIALGIVWGDAIDCWLKPLLATAYLGVLAAAVLCEAVPLLPRRSTPERAA
ncbi:MAG: glycosyltransferase family 87 protein [Dongiaceae bacterium]